eukprot:CAMPEP_0184689630 /NCGR_PEP_ID=MMETSP0312-20130426/30764_1 /TAXON_ID=31354 /ORGANISM="Compsopogon coeruleus, Strain SAG 36.94" /LENGTH=74 /DNA_ID=CAMNT_0027147005 /DNA_START=637 /DNA_END=861 /DNA_ORIENTATION=+
MDRLVKFVKRMDATALNTPGAVSVFQWRMERLGFADVRAAGTWGLALVAGGLWLVQPSEWIRNTFFKVPDEESN